MTQTHTITVEPLGREVECREDQTILDACLRSGVWLPHSCTHGTCATCKAEVLDGDVDHGAASTFALMDYERDEGKLLPCTACPRSVSPSITRRPSRDSTTSPRGTCVRG